MDHTENAYAAMLLTMALSPDREEYARPLSTPEFRRVEALARSSGFGSIGALLDVDISGLVMLLGLTEEEAKTRISSQWPEEKYREAADVYLDGSGTEAFLKEQCRILLQRYIDHL